ncbi:cupin domain-containing protein [Arthrobacter crystallopoietes]|uniref:cupin domain-containing protein n=1 Tax=Crystallibacter crystallopoietes TaxID=37928 RepID=UPI0011114535|nr:cupin domain-containing protein [Arthrobacter crystallopoietes]
MVNTLIAGRPVDVNALELQHLPVPASQIVDGAPTTGVHGLGRFSGLGLGVWEMSVGGMHDVEADEVFLVTAGRATVTIHAEVTGAACTRGAVELGPGSVMLLSAGMCTTWTVHEPLRKLYLAPRL